MFDYMPRSEFISNVLALTFQFLGKNVKYNDIETHFQASLSAGLPHIWNKTELALRLFPNASRSSSLNQFSRFLRNSPDLLAALHTAGWHDTDRLFYPHQVKVVFDYIRGCEQ